MTQENARYYVENIIDSLEKLVSQEHVLDFEKVKYSEPQNGFVQTLTAIIKIKNFTHTSTISSTKATSLSFDQIAEYLVDQAKDAKTI